MSRLGSRVRVSFSAQNKDDYFRYRDILLFVVNSYAEIAQLVEHNLAKVGVASSSLVFRSRDCSGKDAILFIF